MSVVFAMDATRMFYRASTRDKAPFMVVAEIRLGVGLPGQTAAL